MLSEGCSPTAVRPPFSDAICAAPWPSASCHIRKWLLTMGAQSCCIRSIRAVHAAERPHRTRLVQDLALSGYSGTRMGAILVTLKSVFGPQSPPRGSLFNACARILRRIGMNSLATRSARALPYFARSAELISGHAGVLRQGCRSDAAPPSGPRGLARGPSLSP
jgi:hypothetical protein